MFWYSVLVVVTTLLGLITFAGLVLFIMSGCDPFPFVVALICAALAIMPCKAALKIENENTTIHTEVVQMEVTKCTMTSNGYYITVGDEYLIKATKEQYVALNVGDEVSVEITTKTVFGKEKTPTIKLKGE